MQTLDIRTMVNNLNVMLQALDVRFEAAQRAFGVKPNLNLAKDRIADAGATVMETAGLIQEMEALGVHQPPDIIEKLRSRYNALHIMAIEVANCEALVAWRSKLNLPKTVLN